MSTPLIICKNCRSGNTAFIIAYDDSDGWYDHAASPFTNSHFERLRSSHPAKCQYIRL
ncbi:alkaline phosphatase family protein [Paenibacillus solisilvae]|uniref:Alkaline phosphatase family protein n=1 Tax=Paenibacillus solisilvae TaxID=2486751 RepID=A0ABW0VQ83_9BACL